MTVTYPVEIHKIDETYWACFPDLRLYIPDQYSLYSICESASKKLHEHIQILTENCVPIPAPSDIEDIDANDRFGFVTLISTEF